MSYPGKPYCSGSRPTVDAPTQVLKGHWVIQSAVSRHQETDPVTANPEREGGRGWQIHG